jgi:hypothetical protein
MNPERKRPDWYVRGWRPLTRLEGAELRSSQRVRDHGMRVYTDALRTPTVELREGPRPADRRIP